MEVFRMAYNESREQRRQVTSYSLKSTSVADSSEVCLSSHLLTRADRVGCDVGTDLQMAKARQQSASRHMSEV